MSGYELPYSRRAESLVIPIDAQADIPIDYDATQATLSKGRNGTYDESYHTRASWSVIHNDAVMRHAADGYHDTGMANPAAYKQGLIIHDYDWYQASDAEENDIDLDRAPKEIHLYEPETDPEEIEQQREDDLADDQVIGYTRNTENADSDESEEDDDMPHVMEDFEELSDYVQPFILEATTLSEPVCEIICSYLDDELDMLLGEVIIMAQRTLETIHLYQRASKKLGEALPKPSKNALEEAREIGGIPESVRLLLEEIDALEAATPGAPASLEMPTEKSAAPKAPVFAVPTGEELDLEHGSNHRYPERLYLSSRNRKALRRIEMLLSEALDAEQAETTPAAAVNIPFGVAPTSAIVLIAPEPAAAVASSDFEIARGELIRSDLIATVALSDRENALTRMQLESMYGAFERELHAWDKLLTEAEARMDTAEQEYLFAEQVQHVAHVLLYRPSSGIQVIRDRDSVTYRIAASVPEEIKAMGQESSALLASTIEQAYAALKHVSGPVHTYLRHRRTQERLEQGYKDFDQTTRDTVFRTRTAKEYEQLDGIAKQIEEAKRQAEEVLKEIEKLDTLGDDERPAKRQRTNIRQEEKKDTDQMMIDVLGGDDGNDSDDDSVVSGESLPEPKTTDPWEVPFPTANPSNYGFYSESLTVRAFHRVVTAADGVLDSRRYLGGPVDPTGRQVARESPENIHALTMLGRLLSLPLDSVDPGRTVARLNDLDPTRRKAERLLNEIDDERVPKYKLNWCVREKIHQLREALKAPVYAYRKDPYAMDENEAAATSAPSTSASSGLTPMEVDSGSDAPTGLDVLANSAPTPTTAANTATNAMKPSTNDDDWIYLSEPHVLRRRMTVQKHKAASALVALFLMPLATFLTEHENDYMSEAEWPENDQEHALMINNITQLRLLTESARIAVAHYYLLYMTRSWSDDDAIREENLNMIVRDEQWLHNPDPSIRRHNFARVVAEIGQDYRNELTFTNAAMQVIQTAAEHFLTDRFRRAESAKRHRTDNADDTSYDSASLLRTIDADSLQPMDLKLDTIANQT